ncbi:hypothetical protein BDQ17DRAFT_1251355, partial [Cyathus striatus]
IGVWDKLIHIGYFYEFPPDVKNTDIYPFEVLAVVSGLATLPDQILPTRTVIIFLDNENTIALFNSLRAPNKQLNTLLKIAVNLLLKENYQLRVLHVAGSDNTVADALSRRNFSRAMTIDPYLKILPFLPPHLALGAIFK